MQDSEKVAAFLNKVGISADFYHAGECFSVTKYSHLGATISPLFLFPPFFSGMTPKQRGLVQNLWQIGSIRIVCATIAYGMGIDKSGKHQAAIPQFIYGNYLTMFCRLSFRYSPLCAKKSRGLLSGSRTCR